MNDQILEIVIQTRDAVGELKSEVVRWAGETEQVKNQLARLNGSVADQERWRRGHEADHLEGETFEAGFAAGEQATTDRFRRLWESIQGDYAKLALFGLAIPGLMTAGAGIGRLLPW